MFAIFKVKQPVSLILGIITEPGIQITVTYLSLEVKHQVILTYIPKLSYSGVKKNH